MYQTCPDLQMLADAPISFVDWCQIHQALMLTALVSGPMRSFLLPQDVMAHAQQVRDTSLLQICICQPLPPMMACSAVLQPLKDCLHA